MQALMNIQGVHVLQEAEIYAQHRRRFYEREDAFDLSEKHFIQLFRLNKRTVDNIIDIVEQYTPQPRRTSTLDATVQVLTALRFMASGSYQLDIGKNIEIAISQSSVSRCIQNVTEILTRNEIFNEWVTFPRNLQEAGAVSNRFWEKYHFPRILGCIDCTHVAIFPPPRNHPQFPEHIFVNRKNYHSINVQLICDSNLKILNVNARYPGSTHDTFIWNNSNVLRIMQQLYNNRLKFYLLGDSGYALRPWMLTPINNAQAGSPEEAYTECHRRIRSTIERCNGLLKMRFRCLLKHRVLHYSPQVSARIINACVILHNMCLENGIPEPEGEIGDENLDLEMHVNEHEQVEEYVAGHANQRNPELAAGRRTLRQLIRNYFM